jgi:hypothetical protein
VPASAALRQAWGRLQACRQAESRRPRLPAHTNPASASASAPAPASASAPASAPASGSASGSASAPGSGFEWAGAGARAGLGPGPATLLSPHLLSDRLSASLHTALARPFNGGYCRPKSKKFPCPSMASYGEAIFAPAPAPTTTTATTTATAKGRAGEGAGRDEPFLVITGPLSDGRYRRQFPCDLVSSLRAQARNASRSQVYFLHIYDSAYDRLARDWTAASRCAGFPYDTGVLVSADAGGGGGGGGIGGWGAPPGGGGGGGGGCGGGLSWPSLGARAGAGPVPGTKTGAGTDRGVGVGVGVGVYVDRVVVVDVAEALLRGPVRGMRNRTREQVGSSTIVLLLLYYIITIYNNYYHYY